VATYSESHSDRAVLAFRGPAGQLATVIVMRKRGQVWFVLNGAELTTVAMTDPQAIQGPTVTDLGRGQAGREHLIAADRLITPGSTARRERPLGDQMSPPAVGIGHLGHQHARCRNEGAHRAPSAWSRRCRPCRAGSWGSSATAISTMNMK
jgi:hypothetical protein